MKDNKVTPPSKLILLFLIAILITSCVHNHSDRIVTDEKGNKYWLEEMPQYETYRLHKIDSLDYKIFTK